MEIDEIHLVALSKIPLLSATDGYFDWEKGIQDWLGINGFSDLLSRAMNPPVQKAGENNRKYEDRKDTWDNRQKQACAIVQSRLDPLYRKLPASKPRLHEVLLEVKKRLGPTNTVIFQDLARRLQMLTLQDCKSVLKFALRLRTLASELAGLGPSCKMPDAFFVLRFFDGLGSDHSIFRTVFCQKHSLITIERDEELGTEHIAGITLDDVVLALQKYPD